MTKRILFLMSDTGGGHRASAQAIAKAIHHLYPHTYETIIEDIWKEHTPWPIDCMPDTYNWLSGPGVPFWKLLWKGTMMDTPRERFFEVMAPIFRRHAVPYLQKIKPDLVISVHPVLNHTGMDWLAHAGLGHIPFVTVVTDMVTVHPLWICPEVTRCIVPTRAAYNTAVGYGMPRHKLAIYGQPVDYRFAELIGEKRTLRRKLGLDENRRTVMIMGGGGGVGRMYEVSRAIAQTVPQAQLLIVTGHNEKLKAQLDKVAWEIPTHVYGFVENMPELMSTADMLITKAGPGTLSEAFIAGLPPIIFDYIPGQETGNVDYVLENKAGAYAHNIGDIVSLVRAWMDPANPQLQEMSRRAAALARPQAALDIAADVCQLLMPTTTRYESPSVLLEAMPALIP